MNVWAAQDAERSGSVVEGIVVGGAAMSNWQRVFVLTRWAWCCLGSGKGVQWLTHHSTNTHYPLTHSPTRHTHSHTPVHTQTPTFTCIYKPTPTHTPLPPTHTMPQTKEREKETCMQTHRKTQKNTFKWKQRKKTKNRHASLGATNRDAAWSPAQREPAWRVPRPVIKTGAGRLRNLGNHNRNFWTRQSALNRLNPREVRIRDFEHSHSGTLFYPHMRPPALASHSPRTPYRTQGLNVWIDISIEVAFEKSREPWPLQVRDTVCAIACVVL
jgi:hypothetical protein